MANAALRARGSLLIWLDKDMVWLAPHDGSPRHPSVFSNAAIRFCLTIKVLFKLPLRQTTGMVASLRRMADLDWPVPDYSTPRPTIPPPAATVTARFCQIGWTRSPGVKRSAP